MKQHFNFTPTPITKIESWSTEFNCDFYMKRDDLFEAGGGGSKARMLQYILWEAKKCKADYILTAGGPYSNFNRALALMCKKHNLKMRLILFDNNLHIDKYSLNKKIIDFCQVEIVTCDPNCVREIIEIENGKISNAGFKVYYIWGGGKSNQGVHAYYDAFIEIKKQLIDVDYVFTALGTGTTYAGLFSGAALENSPTKVIGFSVAREKQIAQEVVHEILNDFPLISNTQLLPIEINDDFLMGGYGKTSDNLDEFIRSFIKNEGIIVDSIYVGKALYGTYNYLQDIKAKIKNKKIVFLNSGGLYNF